jgi:hypothetical protein
MKPHRITHAPTYHGMPISPNSAAYGCHEEILERLFKLMVFSTLKHSRVLFVRFDVHLPVEGNYPADNQLFTRFMDSFITNRSSAGLDPFYLWVREESTTGHQHWHCLVLFQGNRSRAINEHLLVAERLWAKAINRSDASGLIDHCLVEYNDGWLANGAMIMRNNADFQAVFSDCFRRASYLAKTKTKGNAPDGVREFSSSRLPPNSEWLPAGVTLPTYFQQPG